MPGPKEPTPPPPELPGIRAAASAPAKCILLGEHAVVFGEPCLSVALDLRTTVVAHRVGDRFRVNGYPLTKRHHGYIMTALELAWPAKEPIRFEVASPIPSAGGTGSSAALSVATVASLQRLGEEWDPARTANLAFRAERGAQGVGSPNDTSVATAGGAVVLSPEKHSDGGLRHLWTVTFEDRTWEVHRLAVPELGLVVGHTGVAAKTATQVAKVGRFVERSAFGRETVRAIGGLVWSAIDAIRTEDIEALGMLMDRNQSHLHTMGVNHPRLQELIDAARRTEGTIGAKLTGAGGGGAMIVLTKKPKNAARAIERAGGTAHIVSASNQGLRAEPALEMQGAGLDESDTIREAAS